MSEKEGFLVIEVKPGDEIWMEAIRIVIKDKGVIGIQAPKEIAIETIQPWRKRSGRRGHENSIP